MSDPVASFPPTGAQVTAYATSTVHQIDGLMLLGTFGAEAAPSALIQQPDGRVLRVSTGDRTDFGTIIAIDAQRVTFYGRRGNQHIEMPALAAAS